jgi:hypothetical protein
MMPSEQWRTVSAVAAGAVLTLAAATLAWAELRRVESGALFALRLPGEADPSPEERDDARTSANENRSAAVLVVVAIGAAATFIATIGRHRWAAGRFQPGWSRAILIFFVIAVPADLVTTVRFFHSKGIVFELHPGIRLFGYAYGRSVGPILGKTVQALGILAVAGLLSPRGANGLLIIVSVAGGLAAIHNLVNH